MTFSFLVVPVSVHKRAYKEPTVKRVRGHHSMILACLQLYPRKGKSLTVKDLLGVQIIHTLCTVFELCMKEKKKQGKKKKNNSKLKFSWLILLNVRRIDENPLGVCFTLQ